MSRKSKLWPVLAVVALTPLSGCVDYYNRWDTITLGLGDAVEANKGIHTDDPFPPRAGDTDIDIAGVKSGQAYKRYVEPCDEQVVPCAGGSGGTTLMINAQPAPADGG